MKLQRPSSVRDTISFNPAMEGSIWRAKHLRRRISTALATPARTAACLLLLLVSLASQSRASVLVEYTFGTNVGNATNLPEGVAAHLSATPVIGLKANTYEVVPHSFTEWSPGDMAMRLSSNEGPPGGGRRFEFTLQADPGFTFQLTDMVLTWRANNTYGCAHDIVVWPNLDPGVGLHNGSGGDFSATFGPAYPGWQMGPWNQLAQRTDLTSLVADISVVASGGSYTTDLEGVLISGNVLPVPEPATLAVLGLGFAAFAKRRRLR